MASASNVKPQLKKPISKKTNPSTSNGTGTSSSTPIPGIELLDTQDNYVSSKWRAQPTVCHFLIRNAYCAMLSSRANIIFNPLPPSWLSKSSSMNGYNISQLVEEHNIITNFETVIAMVSESYNDAEILDRLNKKTYELIRFILEGNKMLLKADNLLCTGDIISLQTDNHTLEEMQKLQTIGDGDTLEGLMQFKVEHTALVEDRFRGRDTVYLCHGSLPENWHSITTNKIKIGSKSKYFLNGAAHGNGIYLSNDINLSLGYSGGIHGRTGISKEERENMILAIFQVINNPKWHKSGSIYVVNDEDALVLRYLLVFNDLRNPIVQGIFKAINIKLNSGGIQATEKQKREMEAKNITTIHNKRLMREYQAINKQSPAILGFQVRLTEEDQLGKWMIYLERVDNPRLEEQMRRLGIPAIEIEITFKESYPIAPPFIRVVYPHFKFHSGHITVGGSLCMEMLTNQGWSPTFNVENVITQIKMAIADGGGEIDESNYKKRYTMDEALEAFKRVMSSHGWV